MIIIDDQKCTISLRLWPCLHPYSYKLDRRRPNARLTLSILRAKLNCHYYKCYISSPAIMPLLWSRHHYTMSLICGTKAQGAVTKSTLPCAENELNQFIDSWFCTEGAEYIAALRPFGTCLGMIMLCVWRRTYLKAQMSGYLAHHAGLALT